MIAYIGYSAIQYHNNTYVFHNSLVFSVIKDELVKYSTFIVDNIVLCTILISTYIDNILLSMSNEYI